MTPRALRYPQENGSRTAICGATGTYGKGLIIAGEAFPSATSLQPGDVTRANTPMSWRTALHRGMYRRPMAPWQLLRAEPLEEDRLYFHEPVTCSFAFSSIDLQSESAQMAYRRLMAGKGRA